MCCDKILRRARKFPGVHLFLSLTVRGGGGPEEGGVTRLGGVRKEPSSTCNLTTRLTREQEKCWQTTCLAFLHSLAALAATFSPVAFYC